MVSLASEFPNDNPALHRGTIWVCVEPTGPALAERPIPRGANSLAAAGPTSVGAGEDGRMIVGLVERSEARAPAEVLVDPFDDRERDSELAPFVVEELEPVEVQLEGELAWVDALMNAMPDEPPRADEGALRPVLHDSTVLPVAPDDPFTLLVCTLADVAIGAGSPYVASLLPALLLDGRLPEPLSESLADTLRAAGIWDGAEVTPSFIAVTRAWSAILHGTSDDFSACGPSMLDEWAANLLACLLGAPANAFSLRKELRSRGVAAFGLVDVAA